MIYKYTERTAQMAMARRFSPTCSKKVETKVSSWSTNMNKLRLSQSDSVACSTIGRGHCRFHAPVYILVYMVLTGCSQRLILRRAPNGSAQDPTVPYTSPLYYRQPHSAIRESKDGFTRTLTRKAGIDTPPCISRTA